MIGLVDLVKAAI
uniref:Uncharacterized protein n=1 Tax=Arundo donax TaxID=35708 RepID=A0A0A9A1I1_ARUDO